MTHRKSRSFLSAAVALSCMLCGPSQAFEIGKSGINLSSPERGWKIEDYDDAALKVWHLRADDWADMDAYSGLVAVTISSLKGDPWPEIARLRDTAARVISGQMLTDVRSVTPFAVAAGRFDVAGEDFEGGLDLGAGGIMPISARLLVIRTGKDTLIVTAFSARPGDQAPFAALFGTNGILVASGPGSEALNGRATLPPAPPVAQIPAARPQTPAADPGIADLLQQMEGGFSGAGVTE